MFRRKPTFTPDAAIQHAFGLLEQGGHPATVLRWLERQKVPTEMLAAACHERGTTAAQVFGLDVPEPQAPQTGDVAPSPEQGFFLVDEPGEEWTPAEIGTHWTTLVRNAQAEGITPGVVEWSTVHGCWVIRPQRTKVLQLAANVRPTDGERVAALYPDHELVEFRPYERRAVIGELAPAERQARQVVAGLLGCRPWELQVQVCMAKPGVGHPVEWVMLEGQPLLTLARDKMAKILETAMLHLPGGSEGWRTAWQEHLGRAVLIYGEPERLPALAELLPTLEMGGSWSQLPMGLDPRQRTVALDLKLGPHAGIWAPTGAGKTVLLLGLVAQALTRGHQVVIIDPSKMGADFVPVKAWAAAWGDTIPRAAAILRAVYGEVERRRQLCASYGVGFWEDLPADLRAEKGIQPMLVVVDEFVSLALPRTVNKALDKDHPLRLEAEEVNGYKAEISEYVGRIAREARFVGVHLALAAQRPDAAIISGEMRSNLTSVVQLTRPGAVPSREALGMAFTADAVPAAAETLATLDDGKSRGLAVIAADGGGVSGFRVAYAPSQAIAERLEELGVPSPRKLEVAMQQDEPQVRHIPSQEDLFAEAVTVDAFDPVGDAPGGDVDLSALVTGASEGLWD
ncbi:hypothetical protein EDD41_2736 [Luteococcus japonicus]|uniref:FtsK domain-containing protein n=1 Tax=Luteococcus japonicus TaxID=33984 RepID=A0A3N1ZZ95_9ACTN|nr:FtsK/SpoIIIE domain-containing protein [Luteococcus japonicus]ROR55462.1 hypothetical protein EDD41_2736 [Luteococcus japonicus]